MNKTTRFFLVKNDAGIGHEKQHKQDACQTPVIAGTVMDQIIFYLFHDLVPPLSGMVWVQPRKGSPSMSWSTVQDT